MLFAVIESSFSVQVKYYSGEDFEVERLDEAIKDYQVRRVSTEQFSNDWWK